MSSSGDSTTTACAIAREAGILSPTDYPVMGLPDNLQHLSATRSTMDSTYSSTDTLHSQDFGDSDDRSASGSMASTSASASSSQDGAGGALSRPVKDVLQTTPGFSSNGAGVLLVSSYPQHIQHLQHIQPYHTESFYACSSCPL